MVMFYDEYSTETFTTIVNKYLDAEFVQPMAAQIEVKQLVSKSKAIQSKNGATAFVQPVAGLILAGEVIKDLTAGTLTIKGE